MEQGLIYTLKGTEIKTDFSGVNSLLSFYNWAKQHRCKKVTLNLSTINHIDANLSAVLMALIYMVKSEKKLYVYCELNDAIKSVLFRNGFVAHLLGKGNDNPYFDNRCSTIPLYAFLPGHDEEYCYYLKNKFFDHRGLDNVYSKIKNSLRGHYIEVFNNVGLHAETTKPVFACGQYFPVLNNLRFTLVDLGVGFLSKIKAATSGKINDDKSAIIWATEGLNTTKDKARFGPGGTGLKEIKSYCSANNGSFHICSGHAYVNMIGLSTMEHNLEFPFPGSIVSIILRNI